MPILKRFCLLCCSLLLSVPLCAQVLTARVTDASGKALPHVTVYISSIRQGVVTDTEGIFAMELAEGTYALVISSVGYSTVRLQLPTQKVTDTSLKTIVLGELAYELPTAYVSARREDPALTIMRKAIGLAPYYHRLVASYTAEVYLKSSLQVNKLKGIVAVALDREQRQMLRGLSGVQETVNEIRYVAPDKYTQTIKAEQTAVNVDLKKLGMNAGDVQMGMSNLNIYSPRPNMPLASNAFQNYNFAYMGDSELDGQWIAKIKVTPKRRATDLFTGFLYIVRDQWNVQSLDLTISNSVVTARAQQSYHFVSEDVLLPVAYTIEGKIDGFGIGAEAHFSGSIKYTDIKKNSLLAQRALGPAATAANPPAPEPDPRRQAEAEKRRETVEQILEKPELKPKDMRTLRKIQEETLAQIKKEEQKATGERPSLEVVDNYQMIKDSLRQVRDSAYWASIRPAPLRLQERVALAASDSIMKAPETPEGKKKRTGNLLMGLLTGQNFRLDSTWSLHYTGLLDTESSFNAVDGLVYGQGLRVRKTTAGGGSFGFGGRASYAFARKSFMWNASADYSYWPKQRARWRVEAFSKTTDYAGARGEGQVNDYASLLFKINPSRFYEAKGFDISHRIDIAHGLGWMLGLKWEDRSPLDNHSNYSLFYSKTRVYEANVPNDSPYFIENPNIIRAGRSAVLRMGLSYTPRQPYRMRDGRKIMLASPWPTLAVEWRHGLSHLWNSESDFDFLRFGLTQHRSFGYHNEFEYRVDAGKFFRASNLHFADYHHIYSNQSGLTTQFGLLEFQLPELYALSSPKWYVQAHARYMTPYLALKYLPFFKNPAVKESLQVAYLLQPNMRHYTEFGYALTGLAMMSAGVFVGFEEGRYHSWGFRLSLTL